MNVNQYPHTPESGKNPSNGGDGTSSSQPGILEATPTTPGFAPLGSDSPRPATMEGGTPPPIRRSLTIKIVLLTMLAVAFILASVGGILLFTSYQTIQLEQTSATATAQENARQLASTQDTKAGLNAAATAQARTAATSIAVTATAIGPTANPYPPNRGRLTIVDSLNAYDALFPSNGECVFTNGAYHISAPKNYIAVCSTGPGSTFHNTAAQVELSVLKGDCGGLFFRFDEASANYYLLQICPNGSFVFGMHFGKTNNFSTFSSGISPAIKTGLGRTNLVAFVANEETYSIYVNQVRINTNTVMQAGGAFSQGEIALCAFSSRNATEVAFKNFKLWKF
jgi:hypothetical protein